MKRRKFISSSSAVMMGIPFINKISLGSASSQNDADEVKEYLRKILYTKEEIDGWFAGKLFSFGKYHKEFGWLLNNYSFKDGINDTWSVYTYKKPEGERLMTNYNNMPCRINTYGNSFTQCHQVSDNETWQEVLAAHIQEPVKNFGIGGWSVYQAYLRMLKEEKLSPAEYIIFNIYDDDHLRNLDSWRNIRVKKHPEFIEPTLPFLKVDIKNDAIVEYKNPCPTRESFYKLCSIDEAYQLFKDDFALKIMIAHEKSGQNNPAKNYESLLKLSKTHGIETKIDSSVTLSKTANKIHTDAALFSSRKLINKIEEFAKLNNKKVLYVLSYPAGYIARHVTEGIRWDQKFIDFMNEKNLPLIDLSLAHVNEFKNYRIDINKYLEKYFIGHYTPLGNLFCAYSIREKLVEILNPKPLPYRSVT